MWPDPSPKWLHMEAMMFPDTSSKFGSFEGTSCNKQNTGKDRAEMTVQHQSVL